MRKPWAGRTAETLRGDRWLIVVLVAAVVLRVAVAVAYRPALLWSDTWSYVTAAYTGFPVTSPVDRPSGYPLLLRIIGIPGHEPAVVTILQHLAGLIGGALLWALLRARGVRPLLAATAAGVVLLDSYAVALEQHILTEAFFTAALVAFAFLAVRPRPTPLTVALAGLALVTAVTIRSVGLFVIPVWLVYCLWSYPDRRRRLIAVVSIVAPLLCYVALHQTVVGSSGFSRISGYLLYARVGQIADCKGLDVRADLRALCPRGPVDESQIQALYGGDREAFYLRRAAEVAGDPGGYDFEPGQLTSEELADADRRVREFAMTVIRARPFQYAGLLASTTLSFFTPGKMSPFADYDRPILFPATPRPLGPEHKPLQARFLPGYQPYVGSPSGALRDYQRWVHTPRWLLAAIVLLALGQMAAALLRRDVRPRLRHRREVFLLVGAGVALLLAAALNRFEPRYMLPAVPLIVAGGAFAIEDLLRMVAGRRRAPQEVQAAFGGSPRRSGSRSSQGSGIASVSSR